MSEDRHLSVVPPTPPRTPRSEAQRLRRELREARADAAYWLDAWGDFVNAVDDLIVQVRKRTKGRRYATVLDLRNLLASQAPEGDR